LLVGNKQDLLEPDVSLPPASLPRLLVSAQSAVSDPAMLADLRAWLVDAVLEDLAVSEATPIVVNQRHRQHFLRALDAVQRSRTALRSGAGGDTLALDLRTALHELGAVTGEITNEDVLGTIFSQFCIGK
jgi:tRNA modification GTPase